MSSLTIKPINGNFHPYLIIKCGTHELFTSVGKTTNNKYYNWDDSFKLFLAENEVENFYLECWDFNINNVERASDQLANGYLSIKNTKLDNNSLFQWVNFYDNEQQLVGEILFEILLHKKTPNNTEITHVFNTQNYATENQVSYILNIINSIQFQKNISNKNQQINIIPNLQIAQKIQMQVQSNIQLQQPIINQKYQNIPITYHKINPSQNIQNFNYTNQNIQKINVAQKYANNIKLQINNQNVILQHGVYGGKQIKSQYQSNNY